jgi:hypothetical protein
MMASQEDTTDDISMTHFFNRIIFVAIFHINTVRVFLTFNGIELATFYI